MLPEPDQNECGDTLATERNPLIVSQPMVKRLIEFANKRPQLSVVVVVWHISRANFRLRSPRRPLVSTPHDVGVLERPFSQMLQCFCLAQRDKWGGRRRDRGPASASRRRA